MKTQRQLDLDAMEGKRTWTFRLQRRAGGHGNWIYVAWTLHKRDWNNRTGGFGFTEGRSTSRYVKNRFKQSKIPLEEYIAWRLTQ